MKLNPLYLMGGAAALLVLVAAGSPDPYEGPVTVAGDSYAVGLAQALRASGRVVDDRAVGGTSTPQLPATVARLPVILSIGTNDAAGSASPESIARRARDWLASTGATSAAVVLPHDRLPGALAARCRAVAAAMRRESWPAGTRLVEHHETPAAPDRVHFTPEQYGRIAALAVSKLRTPKPAP